MVWKKIRENNTRKTSSVSFLTLWFEKILRNEMFLLCHPRGKQVTLNFSSVVACAICEKKIIIKKLHFLNMFFFQCLIIILEKCLSLYTDLIFFLNICLALKRAVKIRWMDSRRNPTIVLVGLQESGYCNTEVCCDDYLVQPKGWISNALCYCSPYFVCSVS